MDRKFQGLVKGAKTGDIKDFGVVIKSKSGKSSIDNTLSNRLQELSTLLKHKVADALFK